MKGNPQRPLTQAELEARFRSLASKVIIEEQSERLIETVNRFEELNSMEPLIKLFG